MANFCSSCGSEFNADKINFCPNCGVKQEQIEKIFELKRIPYSEGWNKISGKPEFSNDQQIHYDRAIAVFMQTKALEQYKLDNRIAQDPSLLDEAISNFLEVFMLSVKKWGMEESTARIAIEDYINSYIKD